ncbi:MAG: CPBP family glutamic-type intramembrane protease [Oscillospiraceae bacterium]|nr:CPBP family glutamic-type intramembrane protease [Oscillospiraceae bacterium]
MEKKKVKINVILALFLAIFFAMNMAFVVNEWVNAFGYILPLLAITLLAAVRKDEVDSILAIRLPKRRETVCGTLVLAGAFTLAIGMRFFGQYIAALLPFRTFWGAVHLPEPNMASFLVAMVLVPALCGEVLHRGYLLPRLSALNEGKRQRAICLSAVIFALFSLDIAQLLPQFVLGVAAAWVVLETKNLLLPLAFAVLNTLLVAWERLLLANPYGRIEESLGAAMTIPQVLGILFICAAVAFVSVYFGGRNLHERRKSTASELLTMLLCAFVFLLIGSAFTFFGRGAI